MNRLERHERVSSRLAPLSDAAAEAIMRRYAVRALSANAFFDALVTGSKSTPYPPAVCRGVKPRRRSAALVSIGTRRPGIGVRTGTPG